MIINNNLCELILEKSSYGAIENDYILRLIYEIFHSNPLSPVVSFFKEMGIVDVRDDTQKIKSLIDANIDFLKSFDLISIQENNIESTNKGLLYLYKIRNNNIELFNLLN